MTILANHSAMKTAGPSMTKHDRARAHSRYQWIGLFLREHLQDTPIFHWKIHGFRLRFSQSIGPIASGRRCINRSCCWFWASSWRTSQLWPSIAWWTASLNSWASSRASYRPVCCLAKNGRDHGKTGFLNGKTGNLTIKDWSKHMREPFFYR